jgi:hypothetical protein
MSGFYNRSGFAQFATLALVFVALLGLAGCKKEETQAPPQPPVTTPAQPKYVVRVVLQPETSEELQRVYTYLEDGTTLYKLEIQYRKGGRTQIQYFRTDGTVETEQEMHPFTTKIKSSVKFAADGKTKLEETTWRVSGDLDSKTEFAANGSSKTRRFRNGGQRLLAEIEKAVDGRRTSTFYHKDGTTVWAKTEELTNGDTRAQTWREDGTRAQDRAVYSDRMVVTVYDAQGNASYRQIWSGYRYSYSYYRYYTLQSVEEFDAAGAVKRELEFERYGNRVLRKATDIDGGKKVRVRHFRYDGTLEREEFFNADGTSKVVSHQASENITEPHDPKVKDEPAYVDPLVDGAYHFI